MTSSNSAETNEIVTFDETSYVISLDSDSEPSEVITLDSDSETSEVITLDSDSEDTFTGVKSGFRVLDCFVTQEAFARINNGKWLNDTVNIASKMVTTAQSYLSNISNI